MNPVTLAKKTAKAGLRSLGRVVRPAFETVAVRAAGASSRAMGLRITSSDGWPREFDQALDALPEPPNCTRDQYRELLQDTGVIKRHALVEKNDCPVAIISLRKRRNFWEPVSYQALPGFIAPAVDKATLGAAMNALGLDIRVEAGMGPDVFEIGPRTIAPYDVYALDLTTDFEAHWRQGSDALHSFLKMARNRTKDMSVVVDGEGDLEWTLENWRSAWADDPSQEVGAAPDRLNFWTALRKTPGAENQLQIHAVTLLDGDRRVAGVIHSRVGGSLIHQVSGRLPDDNRSRGGTRVLEASIYWAKEQGYTKIDFGGAAAYKERWGPKAGVRYGVQFRPALVDALVKLGC